mgnify:CR=1
MADIEVKLSRNVSIWHLIAGVLMALLGVYVWFNPEVTLVALALYLGVVFIAVGVGYFIASFSFDSGWYMVVGLLDILVGVIFVANLGLTAASMPIIFALWCLAVGVIQLASAYQYRKQMSNGSMGWTMAAGVLGIIFGFLILTYPAIGAITLTALMGTYVILYGVVEIAEYVYNRKVIQF